jgi:hypothetical protein
MKRNLLQQATAIKAVGANTYATTTARVGAVIDTMGYESAIFAFDYSIASAGTINTLTFSLAEGATTSPVTAVTPNVAFPVPDSTAAAGIQEIHLDLRGLARYIRFTVTPAATGGGTTTGSGIIVMGDRNMNATPSALQIYRKA